MLEKLLLIWGRQFLEPPRAARPLATPLIVKHVFQAKIQGGAKKPPTF